MRMCLSPPPCGQAVGVGPKHVTCLEPGSLLESAATCVKLLQAGKGGGGLKGKKIAGLQHPGCCWVGFEHTKCACAIGGFTPSRLELESRAGAVRSMHNLSGGRGCERRRDGRREGGPPCSSLAVANARSGSIRLRSEASAISFGWVVVIWSCSPPQGKTVQRARRGGQ